MTTSVRCNIANPEDQLRFLKEIHKDFLKVVQPRESGLLDQMIADDLVADTDRESMSGKDVCTRKDQARKLWFHLTKMPVGDFTTKLFPELYKLYPHIIPTKFLAQDEDSPVIDESYDKTCLHHAIMHRVRRMTLLDKLFQNDCVEMEQYRSLAADGRKTENVWTTLFELCTHQVAFITDLLNTHKIHVPPDVEELVTSGIPCTCQDGSGALPGTPRSLRREKVNNWLDESFSSNMPRSSGSSNTSRNSKTSLTSDDGWSLITHPADSNRRLLQPPVAYCEKSTNSEMGREGGQTNHAFLKVSDELPQVSVTNEPSMLLLKLDKPEAHHSENQAPCLISETADSVEATESMDGNSSGVVAFSTEDSARHPQEKMLAHINYFYRNKEVHFLSLLGHNLAPGGRSAAGPSIQWHLQGQQIGQWCAGCPCA